MLDSTPFYANLLIQSAVFGGVFYLLRIGEVINFKLSPSFTNYIRTKFTTNQAWRRRPEYVFQYGYFYSQIVTIFTIIILFSSTAPVIALVGAFYYFVRTTIDSHLLMSVHKKEMDSGVTFYQRILSFIVFSLICYQMTMILHFYLNSQIIQYYIISFMVWATCVLLYFIKSEDYTRSLYKSYVRKEDLNERSHVRVGSINDNRYQALQGDSESKKFKFIL